MVNHHLDRGGTKRAKGAGFLQHADQRGVGRYLCVGAASRVDGAPPTDLLGVVESHNDPPVRVLAL